MRILFVALAVGVGWGLRGEIGGEQGALIPGAFLGLSLAMVSGKVSWWRAGVVMGAVGAVGMSLGGIQSYGLLIGYTRGADLLNVMYGYLMLSVVGGLWGAFATGLLGMLLSSRVRSFSFWIGFIVFSFLSAVVCYVLLIDVLGLLMTPPRSENWALVLGVVLAMWVVNAWQKEYRTCRLVLWGFIAGGVGFMTGQLFQVLGVYLGPTFDWWKVMEISFGTILGGGIAYAVLREYQEDEPIMEISPYMYVISMVFLFCFVPLVTLHNMLEGFEDKGVLVRGESLVMDSYFNVMMRGIGVTVLCIIGLWSWYKRVEGAVDYEGQLRMCFIWSLWSNGLITFFKMSLPELPFTTMIVHNYFFIVMLLLSVWCLFVRFKGNSAILCRKTSIFQRWLLLIICIVLPVMAFLYTSLSLFVHPGYVPPEIRMRF